MVYRVFSHDVTAAMLVSQTNPVGVELFSYANAFFSNKFAQMLATWVKTLYRDLPPFGTQTEPPTVKYLI